LPTNKSFEKVYLVACFFFASFISKTMKIKSLLFFTTLFVFLSCVLTDSNEQHPVRVATPGHTTASAGLPVDISPEQLESIDNEKFTFQVPNRFILFLFLNLRSLILYDRLKYRV
jgi:hypothetical protein